MLRWLRLATQALLVLCLLGLGIAVGLFLVANNRWASVDVPPWLNALFSQPELEVWIPVLLGGWLVGVLATVSLIVGSMYYVWRRRQYEALVAKLERELSRLRNLPFTDPAPLEDLPEGVDADAAAIMRRALVDDEDVE